MSMSARTAATAVPMVMRLAPRATMPPPLGIISIRYSMDPRVFCRQRNIGTLYERNVIYCRTHQCIIMLPISYMKEKEKKRKKTI